MGSSTRSIDHSRCHSKFCSFPVSLLLEPWQTKMSQKQKIQMWIPFLPQLLGLSSWYLLVKRNSLLIPKVYVVTNKRCAPQKRMQQIENVSISEVVVCVWTALLELGYLELLLVQLLDKYDPN